MVNSDIKYKTIEVFEEIVSVLYISAHGTPKFRLISISVVYTAVAKVASTMVEL